MSIQRGESWPLSRIKAHPRNARKHSKGQVEALAASIEEYDQTMPILVDEDGLIIAGHGRYATSNAAMRFSFGVEVRPR